MIIGLIVITSIVLPLISLAFFVPGTEFDNWLPRAAEHGLGGNIMFVVLQFVFIFVPSAGMVGFWSAVACAWMGIGPSVVIVLRLVLFRRRIVLWKKELPLLESTNRPSEHQ